MKASDWISVKTSLPPKEDKKWACSDVVWVYDEECGQRKGYLDDDNQWCDANECWYLNNVTHWMPLPEDPPKEKTES